MLLWKNNIKNILMAFGVVLWVGALSPEIFVQSGLGCILDENGEELSAEDAKEFMESYFYENSDTSVEVKYKFELLEWLK